MKLVILYAVLVTCSYFSVSYFSVAYAAWGNGYCPFKDDKPGECGKNPPTSSAAPTPTPKPSSSTSTTKQSDSQPVPQPRFLTPEEERALRDKKMNEEAQRKQAIQDSKWPKEKEDYKKDGEKPDSDNEDSSKMDSNKNSKDVQAKADDDLSPKADQESEEVEESKTKNDSDESNESDQSELQTDTEASVADFLEPVDDKKQGKDAQCANIAGTMSAVQNTGNPTVIDSIISTFNDQKMSHMMHQPEKKANATYKAQDFKDNSTFENLLTPEEGQRIANQARTWKNTPYLTGGEVKGTNGGTDCSHSTKMIYEEAGFPYTYRNTKSFAESPNFVPSPNNAPQVGDVGLYEGHMLIYDPNAEPGMDSWSAHRPGISYGSVKSSWPSWGGQVKWYRYRKQGLS